VGPVVSKASEDISWNRQNPPRYPPDALRRGIEGTVMLLVLVGVDGRVEDVKLEKSSGHASLDRAALQVARKWRFNPAMRDGVPFADWALVPVRFSLDG
jgi:protein TonB